MDPIFTDLESVPILAIRCDHLVTRNQETRESTSDSSEEDRYNILSQYDFSTLFARFGQNTRHLPASVLSDATAFRGDSDALNTLCAKLST